MVVYNKIFYHNSILHYSGYINYVILELFNIVDNKKMTYFNKAFFLFFSIYYYTKSF